MLSTCAMIASACWRFDVIVCPDAGPTASKSQAAHAAARTTIGAHPVREPLMKARGRSRTDPPVAVWPVTSGRP
jgi:hypothetical protein